MSLTLPEWVALQYQRQRERNEQAAQRLAALREAPEQRLAALRYEQAEALSLWRAAAMAHNEHCDPGQRRCTGSQHMQLSRATVNEQVNWIPGAGEWLCIPCRDDFSMHALSDTTGAWLEQPGSSRLAG